MADVSWLFVERCQGRMTRVTALDDDLEVVSTHAQSAWPPGAVPDEVQLLRAVELAARAHVAVAAPDLDLIGD